ncbi:MAG: zinc-dependent alcohol dehydrogenase family protein [Actinomycetota bacterium]|nr:zinc-dependent alcohol dehydrogenase family protein [Actinomycetota bacterium]
MKAAVIEKPGKISIKEIPYPKPGSDEVVIQVKNCGICGTDFHIYNGDYLGSYPIVPGHEISGIVVEVGPDVPGLKIGNRVTADPNIYCGACYFCRTNRPNHCQNWQALGVTRNGGFAEYIAVTYKNVYKIPDNMSFLDAAFIEPVSCIVYGLRRLKIISGDNVLIFGAGPIGMQMAQLVQHGNAASVTITDLNQARLKLAKKLGISKTVLSDDKLSQTLKRIAPLGFDVVIDATGVAKVAEMAVNFVKNTGKIMFFGVCPPEDKVMISPFEIYKRDLEIYGSYALCYTFYPALDLINNGALDVKSIVSNRVSLKDLPMVFKSKKFKNDSMKIMLEIRIY